jgi:hypothetical protein
LNKSRAKKPIMKKINSSTSACRFCRFYEPEGRRGGSCQMLGVPVESSWEACNFASPPFETALEKLENILQLETSIALDSSERVIPQKIDAKIEGDYSKMAAPKKE